MGNIKSFFHTDTVTVTHCESSKNAATAVTVSKKTDSTSAIKVSIQPRGGRTEQYEYGENSGDIVVLYAAANENVKRNDIITIKSIEYLVIDVKSAENYLRIDCKCLK